VGLGQLRIKLNGLGKESPREIVPVRRVHEQKAPADEEIVCLDIRCAAARAMVCDQCALRRNLAAGHFDQCGTGSVTAKGLVEGVVASCLPQLYGALAGSPPDHIITL
jgi:hypothetical protein